MDKFISELKNTADKVAKKSGELVELSKAKLNIATTKSNIEANFKVLGRLVYMSQKENEEINAEELENIILKIDSLHENLEVYSNIVAGLTNKKICPNCQKANDSDATFCSGCGTEF